METPHFSRSDPQVLALIHPAHAGRIGRPLLGFFVRSAQVMDVISKACRGNYRYIDCVGEETTAKREREREMYFSFGKMGRDHWPMAVETGNRGRELRIEERKGQLAHSVLSLKSTKFELRLNSDSQFGVCLFSLN